MSAILDPNVEVLGNRRLALRLARNGHGFLVDIDLDLKVLALAPVLLDLGRQIVGDGLDLRLPRLIILLAEPIDVRASQGQQGARRLDAGRRWPLAAVGKLAEFQAPRQQLVLAEVEELRHPLAQKRA